MRERSETGDSRAAFAELVRQLDGEVALPVFCVDETGRILSFALPADIAASRQALEGFPLQSFFRPGAPSAGTWLQELHRSGRLRVTLDFPISGSFLELEVDAVLVDLPVEGRGTLQWDLLPRIMDATQVQSIAVDGRGRIRVINAAARALLGWQTSDLLGHSVAAIIENPEVARDFQARLLAGRARSAAARLTRSDGSSIPAQLNPRRIVSPEGEGQGWIVTLLDRRAPGEVRAAAESDLVTCVQRVAHDLRSPITSLRGFARLLEQDLSPLLDHKAHGYLESLRSSVDRMQDLLEHLLEHLSLQTARCERSLLSPGEVLLQLQAELKPSLEARGIRLRLPESPPPLFADPARFRQVALNLLVNAIQHMGEVLAPEIRVSVVPGSGETALVVRDNGVGMPPEQCTRLYELFARGPQEAGPEAGLGLSIVSRILRVHGGRIEVESAPGRGSSFRAVFPDA